MYLKAKVTQLIIFLVAIIGVVLSFLSPIVGHQLTSGDNITSSETKLYTTLISNQLENVLISCISLCIPILSEQLLDSNIIQRPYSINRCIRVGGLFVPSLVLLANQLTPNFVNYIPSILDSQFIIYVYGITSILHELNPVIWTSTSTILLTILYTIANILNSYQSSIAYNSNIHLTIIIILSINTIILLWKCIAWAQHILVYNIRAGEAMSRDLYGTSVQAIEFIILVFGGTIFLLLMNETSWSETVTNFIVIRMYVDAGVLLLLTVFYDRLVRKELMHAQNTLEIKRNFVNYISHEMRTPLNTVFLGLKLLRDDFILNGDPPERIDILDDLKTSCDVTLSTLNELLTFDKLEAGILKLETSTIPIWDFIIDTIKPFDIQAQQAGIDLVIHEEQRTLELMRLLTMEGDENKLGQVLRNFVSNALKFTPRGGTVTIKLSRHRKEIYEIDTIFSARRSSFSGSVFSLRRDPSGKMIRRPSKRSSIILNTFIGDQSNLDRSGDLVEYQDILRIEVIDTGAGISEENQKKVFREVIQFHPGRLQKGGGSGLGLYITRGIVELHKGTVSVYSAGEGQGCTFTVELPMQSKAISNRSPNSPLQQIRLDNSNNNTYTASNSFRMSSMRAAVRRQLSSPEMSSSSSLILPRQLSHEHIQLSSNKIEINNNEEIDHNTQIQSQDPPEEKSQRHRMIHVKSIKHLKKRPANSHNKINNDNNHNSHPTLSSDPSLKDSTKRLLRILVVDDSLMNRKMLCRHLKKRSEILYEADDGAVALKTLKDAASVGTNMDVILMDHQMPNMDGPTAARAMRDMGYKGIIIGISGNAQAQEREIFISHGANFVLTKPLDITKLEDILKGIEIHSNRPLLGMSSLPSMKSLIRTISMRSQKVMDVEDPLQRQPSSRRLNGNGNSALYLSSTVE